MVNQGLSTVSKRGQIVIPKNIRDLLGIEASDKVYFRIEDNNKIMLKPILTIEQAMGFIKTEKKYTNKDYKKAVVEAVKEKFEKKIR